jgi:hypothetical protein
MQNLASYSIKAVLDGEAKVERVSTINSKIDNWLRGKGVGEPQAATGTFKSLSGDGEGWFSRKWVEADIGRVLEVRLVETERNGGVFTTEICVYQGRDEVWVYSRLYVDGARGVIAPLNVYPRCPKIIREIISSFEDWEFSGARVPSENVIDARGGDGVLKLCREIRDKYRSVPIIVISIDKDDSVWPDLSRSMSREMIGLAHVAIVDEAASWVMTDELGKSSSCYLGAVRLYWPNLDDERDKLSGFVWTSSRLLDEFGGGDVGMKRFLSSIRSKVMSVAALTIAPPRGVQDVHMAAFRARLDQMEKSAIEKELNTITEENYALSEQLKVEKDNVARLEYKIIHLRDRIESLSNGAVDGKADLPKEDGGTAPTSGEIRYYKKIGSGGGVDVMVRSVECSHNAWQPAFKADQAEKGIHEFEGRNDWASIQHCGTCTGGGRWRVRW